MILGALAAAWLWAAGIAAAGDDSAGLASPDPAVRLATYQKLQKTGAASVAGALEGFESAPSIARELRARLVRESGTSADLDRVVAWKNDPNPAVRAELAAFAGRRDFAYAKAEIRSELLLFLAKDVDPDVRRLALAALGRLAHRSAIAGLAELIRSGDADQRTGALRALAATQGSAVSLLEFADWIESTVPSLRAEYLISLGTTGQTVVLTKLLEYANHPTDGFAARTAVDLLARQLLYRRQDADYLALLDAWKRIDPIDALQRRARFEMFVHVDMGALADAARALDALSLREGARGDEVRTEAKVFLAIAELGSGRGAEAERALASAAALIEGQPFGERKDFSELKQCVALAHVKSVSAFNALLNPFDGAPKPEVRLREAYALHKRRVESALFEGLTPILRDTSDPMAAQWRIQKLLQHKPLELNAPWGFDDSLDYDISIDSLISVVLARRGRGPAAFDAGMRMLEILGDENPHEFVVPGKPDRRSEVKNPFEYYDFTSVPGSPISPVSVSLRTPVSTFPRDLGRIARTDLGDFDAAGRLLDAVIERASWGTSMNDLATWVGASLERAGISMDANKPDEADAGVDAVLARLDGIKRANEEVFDAEAADKLGGAVPEARTAEAKRWLDFEQKLRSQALITKAVNTNVVRGDPAKAAVFAKKGVELEPSEFNRVLLACYLAREGNGDEARAILRDAPDSPQSYYNLACTYSLLGEKETALRYLERDFQENHSDVGGLERQRAWARKDPDLKSLRGDARFEALVQTAEAAPRKPAGK